MFCESCGHKVESDDKFCPYCGKAITAAQEETIYLPNEEGANGEALDDRDGEEEVILPPFTPDEVIDDRNGVEVYPPTVRQPQKKWPGRLLTGLLLTAVIVLAVNIAVGLIYLRELESQDDNYELPELNITEPDDSSI